MFGRSGNQVGETRADIPIRLDVEVPRRRPVTIKQVADLAGVSQMTVSRVFNHPDAVKQDTRVRVEKAVKTLNYRPNLMARNLAGGNSQLLGLPFHGVNSAYMTKLLVEAIRICRERGHHLLVEDITETGDGNLDGEDVLKRLKSLSLDGLIIPPHLARDNDFIGQLALQTYNSVILGAGTNVETNLAKVSSDDRGGSRKITRYLIERGHTHIGFIGGLSDSPAGRARKLGFELALTDFDIAPDPALMLRGDYSIQSGMYAGEKLLSLKIPPTAVVCANDDMAAGLMMSAIKRGIKLPDELSVVGYDNTSIAVQAWPGITTVQQPIRRMTELTIDYLTNGEFPTDMPHTKQISETHIEVYDMQIVERESVARLS